MRSRVSGRERTVRVLLGVKVRALREEGSPTLVVSGRDVQGFLTSGSQSLGPWCEGPGLQLGRGENPVLTGGKVRCLKED